MATIKVTRIGEHFMEGNLYKDEKGRYYVDANNDHPTALYRLCPPNNPEGEPCDLIEDFEIANPFSEKEERMKAFEFEYRMLGRMKNDALAYFGKSGDESRDKFDCRYHNEHFIWGQSIRELINGLKEYWNKIPEDLKPEWLTWEQILEWEDRISA